MLDKQGKYTKAESLQAQTLVTREKALQKECHNTLKSMYCFAHLLAAWHCYDESAALYERSCMGYSNDLGSDRISTHWTL